MRLADERPRARARARHQLEGGLAEAVLEVLEAEPVAVHAQQDVALGGRHARDGLGRIVAAGRGAQPASSLGPAPTLPGRGMSRPSPTAPARTGHRPPAAHPVPGREDLLRACHGPIRPRPSSVSRAVPRVDRAARQAAGCGGPGVSGPRRQRCLPIAVRSAAESDSTRRPVPVRTVCTAERRLCMVERGHRFVKIRLGLLPTRLQTPAARPPQREHSPDRPMPAGARVADILQATLGPLGHEADGVDHGLVSAVDLAELAGGARAPQPRARQADPSRPRLIRRDRVAGIRRGETRLLPDTATGSEAHRAENRGRHHVRPPEPSMDPHRS